MKQALDEANHTIDAYGLLMRLDEQLRETNWKLEQARLEQNWPVMRQGEGIIHAFTMVRQWITASLPHLKLDLLLESDYRYECLCQKCGKQFALPSKDAEHICPKCQ